MVDQLLWLVNEEVTNKEMKVRDSFVDEMILANQEQPWYIDMANFKATGVITREMKWHQKKKFLRDATYLFRMEAGNLLRMCVSQEEAHDILWHCHNSPYSGLHSLKTHITMLKVMTNAKEPRTSLEDKNCLSRTCKK